MSTQSYFDRLAQVRETMKALEAEAVHLQELIYKSLPLDEKIMRRVQSVIRETLGLEHDVAFDVNLSTLFDSEYTELDELELIMSLEDEFAMTFEDDFIIKCDTPSKITCFIDERLKAKK